MKGLQLMELEALYSIFFNKQGEVLKRNKITPFLVSVPPDYDDYLLKIMFYEGVGIPEWAAEINFDLNIHELMALHAHYMEKSPSSSPFWSYYHYLVHRTNKVLTNDSICWVPNTLTKFCRQGKASYKDAASCNNELLRSELICLNPDMFVIMSNPNNRKASLIIEEAMGEYESVPTKIDRVYRLKFKDSEIPCLRVDSVMYQEVTRTKQVIQDFLFDFALNELRARYAQS